MSSLRLAVAAVASFACLGPAISGQAPAASSQGEAARPANPYQLEPFFADFPVQLVYPNQYGREYDRTRRQVLERLVANLQGNVRREAWLMAMEFFWHAPADAYEPLVAAMDRLYGNPLSDTVRNCVEAMGKMGDLRFDAALQRALEHPNAQVRQAALASLGRSGKQETLLALGRHFEQMDGRARTAWLQAVRDRLPDERVAILARLLQASYPVTVREQLLAIALELPGEDLAAATRELWDSATGKLKVVIAAARHQIGDGAGTAWLQAALQGQDTQELLLVLEQLARCDLGVLRSTVLQHSTHPRADVRHGVARLLTVVPGDDVADVYEVLASPEEPLEIREVALRELTRRGRTSAVGALLDEAGTATGTRLQVLLHLLATSGDPRAVALLVERFERAPETERRPFLQALAQNNSPAAGEALLTIFRGPPRVVGRGVDEAYTTIGYLATLLLNLRGQEATLLNAFRSLPKEDYLRRAALATTLSGLAADRKDEKVRDECLDELRRLLFDRSELPQLRVLALNLLTPRALTVEDALRLKRQRFDEAAGLRSLFADFLNDYF